jgi:UDP-N-acetyl-2-amino-2-deoxyglucuronate dehydrogenase
MKRFALIGAGGYVAPKHLQAIKETGNMLVAALDKNDSVGILDRYFPNCDFFTEMERFDRHLEKIKREGKGVDYISICTPNYLHDSHCRLAMRIDANAICEKPLVLNPENLDQLKEIEHETGKKVFVILQLRLHPELQSIREEMSSGFHNVLIDYITPRGNWYHVSWKGQDSKSGGLASNIGIHLFDMVLWLFGNVEDFTIINYEETKVKGILWLERAKVNFNLSVDRNDLPDSSLTSYRVINVDKKPLKLDGVFTELHTSVYRDILSGGGFGIEDARPSVVLVDKIRNLKNRVR